MIFAVFKHPDAGYTSDRQNCRDCGLVVNKSYEMRRINVGDSSSRVYLVDYPGKDFNSVHFEYYELIDGQIHPVDVYSRFYDPDNYF